MKKIRIIALISALFMFACGYNFLNAQGEKLSGGAKDQKIVNVVVASKNIPPYTTLTSDMFTVKQTVANAFLTDYYSSVSDVAGGISATTLFSGEVVTTTRVTKDKNAVGLSAQLENGKRAITVEVDTEQGVANNLKIGNYVDVVYTSQVPSTEVNGIPMTAGLYLSGIYAAGKPDNSQDVGEMIGQYYAVIALQKIKVVALNSSTSDVATEAAPEYSSVTLEVTPAEAAKIALLNDNGGKIQLVLRPMEDDGTVTEPRDTVLK
ncbi:pilus assembly protein CpaB [Sporobacter termitidis DSM 10068]|uniref:Pilus assembly protein CpaB n=1 Tax=Sporobacter termitidis DSM 10068 TaxID=1123282 RepID=A0A1M5Z3W7_9FIRM|nr:Flp pilus assembly protein CpaB [Sporobacter termitidis]SHI18976.1 pilus assembly protein CpaB [Sporobacter termitidis DSM 10068]